MQVLTLTLLWICAIGTKSWEVNKVEGIIGKPLAVLIDSESNTYVIAEDPSSFLFRRLFKFDPEKNIILEVDITDSIVNYYISNNDDFYLTRWTTGGTTAVNTIKSGSLKWETIADIGNWVLVYMDNDGNLIYNGEDFGVYLLKYNTTEAVKVQNLENFTISKVLTDKNGDIYLGGAVASIDNGTVSGEHQFAVITAESKENIPEGVFIDGVFDNATSEFIYDLKFTGNNELLISISNGGTEGAVKKYSNNTLTTLLSNEVYQYYGFEGNDKISLIRSCDYSALRCRLSYLIPNGEIVEIVNLLNKTTDADHFNNAYSEDGDVYFSDFRKVDQSSLEFLNYTDTETIPIYFNETVEIGVYNVLLDGNEDLWVLTTHFGIYYLEKGSFNLEKVQGTEELGATVFSVDKRTNEVFAISENGLFVVTK